MAVAGTPEKLELLLKERFETTPPPYEMNENGDIIEEIEGDEELKMVFGFARSLANDESGNSPAARQQENEAEFVTDIELEEGAAASAIVFSPEKSATRDWNISPISELLDDDDEEEDAKFKELKIEEDEEKDNSEDSFTLTTCSGAAPEKVTPENSEDTNRHGGDTNSGRASFPRISDGRSSPILSYSPSLIKSPSSSNSCKSSRNPNSPTNNGERVQRKPRNITRMLDNISDHSSEEEANVSNVGVMMAKFTV